MIGLPNIGADSIGAAMTGDDPIIGTAPQPHAQLLSTIGAVITGGAQQSTGAGQQLETGGGQAGAHRGAHGLGAT
jgi:hypothetical protein